MYACICIQTNNATANRVLCSCFSLCLSTIYSTSARRGLKAIGFHFIVISHLHTPSCRQAGSHFPTDRPTTTADEWKLVQGSDCLNTVTLGFSHIILYCVLESFSRFYCFPSSALLSVYSPPWSPLLCHGRPGRTQGYNYYTCSIICPASILLRLLASSPLSSERGIVPVI